VILAVLTVLLPGCAVETDPCIAGICEHPAPAKGKADTFGEPTPWTNWKRDILSTALAFDLSEKTATARIKLAASTRIGASFDVHGIEVTEVTDGDGKPLEHKLAQGRLDVDLPAEGEHTVAVEYKFNEKEGQKGLGAGGETLTWPYYCGNLFPCKSDPSDGLQFELELSGVPEGKQAVFPAQIPADAPSYMLAWVTGEYGSKVLGKTDAGTEVSVYWRPGEESRALEGTDGLVQVVGWLEKNIGPYTFGSSVASVSVRWGGGAYGGMEHHPLWHVSDRSIDDFYVHAHEAAHGWFGNGVRLRCWEDFVLSEGTVCYLAARAMAATKGAQVDHEIWERYRRRLERALSWPSYGDGIAWPDTQCNAVDLIEDDLFTSIPYMKGAFFYRAVEQVIGAEGVTRAISSFYKQYAGKAASMQGMVDALKAEAKASAAGDPDVAAAKVEELAKAWLRSSDVPELPDLP
jgi:aminopeptidase N